MVWRFGAHIYVPRIATLICGAERIVVRVSTIITNGRRTKTFRESRRKLSEAGIIIRSLVTLRRHTNLRAFRSYFNLTGTCVRRITKN